MQNLRRKNESGRSMVEMLGILAIIGVLSVGGVNGYGLAMKKHKANELLHQASMLATTISAQIQSKGELPKSIEDFGNGKYGTFKKPEKANDEQFKMEITGMDEAVCTQVEKMAGGMVRKAECNGTTLTLTYNNNLSTDSVSSDFDDDEEGCMNSGFNWCLELSTPACKKDCCSDITLNDCQESCDSTTGEITPKYDEIDCTTTDGKEGTCSDGVCEPTCLDNTSGVKCLSNTTDENGNTIELCSGYYCKVGGACSDFVYTITAGPITALPSTIEKIGKYHKSDESMGWDAAYYYCEALSKIDDSITGMAKRDGFEKFDGVAGYCWLNTLADGSTTPTSSNECYALYMQLSSGGENINIRYSDDYGYAVCE